MALICRAHLVRLENLPLGTNQSQIEDIVSTYGQVLDLKLELTIRDGKQSLAAVAQYVCTHQPKIPGQR